MNESDEIVKGGKYISEVSLSQSLATILPPPPPVLANIPDEMVQADRWVLWRNEKKDGRITKIPYSDPSNKARSNDPSTWKSLQAIILLKQKNPEFGIGFNLGEGWCGIDIDHCKGDNGEWDPDALEAVSMWNSYTEASPSGTGLHVIVRGNLPDGADKRRGNREIYDSGRYFTVTGNVLPGYPITIREISDDDMCLLHKSFIPPKEGENVTVALPPPVTGITTQQEDDEIIRKATAAKNGGKFRQLFHGDIGGYDSPSNADQAFCCLLAYWTRDPAQIDRIFRNSRLNRDKLDRDDYRDRTIDAALAMVKPKDQLYQDASPLITGEVDSLPEEGLFLTEIGNAERFVHQHGDKIKYCAPFKEWYYWNDKIWEPDNKCICQNYAIQTTRSIYNEAYAKSASDERKATGGWATASESLQKQNAMIQLAKSLLAVGPEIWDTKPDLFNLQNGTYNLKTNEFSAHRKEDFLTMMGGVEYDPDALCPVWDKHLNLIFNGDAELILGFQELLGYSLLSGNPDEIFVICWGSGRNGKSKTFDIIEHIHGDYSKTAAFKTIAKKDRTDNAVSNDIARLKGSRFLRVNESNDGETLNEGLIKQMSGKDKLAARFLHKEYFEFEPEFILFLQTNHKPVIKCWDAAIDARLWLVPFNKFIEEGVRDHTIFDKLKSEGSGIFNWMIEGLKRYQGRGKLDKPNTVKSATSDYKSEQDRVGDFVESCCDKGKNCSCSMGELYNEYYAYCLENSIEKLSEKGFREALKTNHGVTPGERTAKKRFWKGIQIKPSDTSDKNDTKGNNSPHEGSSQGELPESGVTECHGVTKQDPTPPNHCDYSELAGIKPTEYISTCGGSFFCTLKGCGKPAALRLKSNIQPLPLCTPHYRDWKEQWKEEEHEHEHVQEESNIQGELSKPEQKEADNPDLNKPERESMGDSTKENENKSYPFLLKEWNLPDWFAVEKCVRICINGEKCRVKGCKCQEIELWNEPGRMTCPICDNHYHELVAAMNRDKKAKEGMRA